MIGTELARRGHTVVPLTATVGPYVIGNDDDRDARIIDVDRWAAEFVPVDGFVEGHIAHLLPCDRVVVLRLPSRRAEKTPFPAEVPKGEDP